MIRMDIIFANCTPKNSFNIIVAGLFIQFRPDYEANILIKSKNFGHTICIWSFVALVYS